MKNHASHDNGYKLAIFDLDGTLADTAVDVHLSMNLLRNELNLQEIAFEEARQAIGPGPELFIRLLTDGQDRFDVQETLQRFREIYLSNVLNTTQAFSGIPEVLQRLAGRGVTLAVATNKPGKFTHKILHGLGIHHHFMTVITSEDVKKLKPAPDAILKAMGIAAAGADQTLMIGDTEYDVRAAHAAGVDVCAVGFGYSPRDRLLQQAPTFIVEEALEILSLWPAAAQ